MAITTRTFDCRLCAAMMCEGADKIAKTSKTISGLARLRA
ncbi:hypothetical protein SAMN05444123_101629 [Rhodopseudomonas pseudopalustris]|uniref:Uncharacterized protein n=1 Tax=Rhodopseudomonas pseudopalustris TaxID=1513892 RepID=A0A1H8MPV2_9BRAD|nr:hypothetical protein SAMN05444123_101629 [Rhodopseudomonas pseudopalustris]